MNYEYENINDVNQFYGWMFIVAVSIIFVFFMFLSAVGGLLFATHRRHSKDDEGIELQNMSDEKEEDLDEEKTI